MEIAGGGTERPRCRTSSVMGSPDRSASGLVIGMTSLGERSRRHLKGHDSLGGVAIYGEHLPP